MVSVTVSRWEMRGRASEACAQHVQRHGDVLQTCEQPHTAMEGLSLERQVASGLGVCKPGTQPCR